CEVRELYLQRCGRTARARPQAAPAVALVSPEGPARCGDCCADSPGSDGDVDPTKSGSIVGRAQQEQLAGSGGRDGRFTSIESEAAPPVRSTLKRLWFRNGQTQSSDRFPTCPNLVRFAGPTTKAFETGPITWLSWIATRMWLDSASVAAQSTFKRAGTQRIIIIVPILPWRATSAPPCPPAKVKTGSSAGWPQRPRSPASSCLAAVEQHCSNSPCPPGRCLGLLSGEAALSLPLPFLETLDRTAPASSRSLHHPPGLRILCRSCTTRHRFECLQSETGLLIRAQRRRHGILDAPSGAGSQTTHLKAKVTFSNLRLLQTKPEEPPFTTFKYVGKSAEPQARAIDYIWYRRLRPLALLEIPPRDSVESNGLPCAAFPSDHHFCLSVDFCFCKN
uniref:Uncharacterized protein n=1 Tax=Macrostomum lignano TaxID=282301 RepID=A0A1I8JPZ2_9PLAT